MPDWNSKQYMKFKNERTRPSVDLINRIDITPKAILDIGCGPGNSTNRLYEKFSNAEILGIDNSEDMLQNAIKSYPELNFEKCSVPDELDNLKNYDLIFSNACLHWIPEHRKLFPKLMHKLNDGGMLAVQMPLVQIAPFYTMLNKILLDEKWSELRNVNNFHNLMPDETYNILSEISSDVIMWETTYYHILPSRESIINWYKGSGLRTYLEVLNDIQKEDFIYEIKEKLKETFPIYSDGKVILKMPRLFFIAKK
ncbi:MAG: methyltransferase domain-containing protein [Oscillospiraceae bacterium]|nr:methyltransferase domain-containing protein [Oscillospiraceae bacterium]